MPSGSYSPYCEVLYYRRIPGGSGLVGPFQLNAIYQINASNTTTNGVNQAQVQVFDPNHIIAQTLNPNPMDVITIRVNGIYTPSRLDSIWVGYIDIVTNHFDTQTGYVLVLNCSSPYKLWENTTINLGQSAGGANDPFQLAIASISGIAANDVISITAQAVGFPGPLRQLPVSPMVYLIGNPVAGLWNLTVPDNSASQPDLQTYSAIVQGMLADTATEMFFDEQGNLIFREIGYLNTNALPTKPNQPLIPRRVLAQDIISSDIGLSDQGVITEVRVRWNYDYNYPNDGYWVAPQGIINQLGPRVLVISAPWIMSLDAANFLATAVGLMSASGVAVGSITMPVDPSYKIGMLCQVQDATVPAGNYSYYYIVGIVYSLVWGQPWTQTLQLGYGRAPSQQFPYIGTESTPQLSNFGAKALAGVPTGNGGNLVFSNGQLSSALVGTYNSKLGPEQITADPAVYPVGTKVILRNAAGQFVGPSRNGTYTVVGGTKGQAGIGINAHIPGTILGTTVATGTVAAATSTSAASTGSGTGTPGPTVAPANGGVIAGADAPPGTLVQAPSGAPANFPYWPVDPSYGISQPFGPTSFTGELPYTDSKGVYAIHYHTGIDIPQNLGTPIHAPIGGGTIIFVGWDPNGYGNYCCLQVDQLVLLFGHQQQVLVVVGDQPAVNGIIGQVDSTGNSTGNHLHFGVYDTRIGFWIDPAQFLTNAIP